MGFLSSFNSTRSSRKKERGKIFFFGNIEHPAPAVATRLYIHLSVQPAPSDYHHLRLAQFFVVVKKVRGFSLNREYEPDGVACNEQQSTTVTKQARRSTALMTCDSGDSTVETRVPRTHAFHQWCWPTIHLIDSVMATVPPGYLVSHQNLPRAKKLVTCFLSAGHSIFDLAST